MDVLCVGLMVCDIPLATIPPHMLELDKWDIANPIPSPGGDALNVAIALSKLGARTCLVGNIGQDLNGDFILKQAAQHGVDISRVVQDTSAGTAVSYILIEENGERHFLTSSEIHHHLTVADIPDSLIQSANIVYFGSALVMDQMDNGGIASLFKKAHQYGKITALDAAMPSEEADRENKIRQIKNTLFETDIFLPSLEEAQLITGCNKPGQIARALSGYGIKTLGIKLGKKGCYLTDFKTQYTIGCFEQFNRIDTTGAGDSFVSGFLYAALKQWHIKQCGIFANAVAGFSIESIGSVAGIPGIDKVLECVGQNATSLDIKESLF